MAGDGLERFEAAERGVDLRSAYVASDGERLWARAYVSSEEAPSPTLRVYVFIDADDDAATGGAGASADIDPALGSESSRGGYEVVLGMQAGTVVGGVIVGPRASELIYPIAIAVERRLTVDQVSRVFAVYPSLSGSITDAARAMHVVDHNVYGG